MLDKIVKFFGLLVKIITWLLANGIPFVRGIIEEIKKARTKIDK